MNAGELEEGLSSQVEENYGSTSAFVALIACKLMLLLMIAA